MGQTAVVAANISLAKAAAAVEAMRNAKTFPELETAWSDLLSAGHRIFSKLEQGAKASGTSAAWYGRQKNTRRTYPLLSYIHHARNVDEHRIGALTSHK